MNFICNKYLYKELVKKFILIIFDSKKLDNKESFFSEYHKEFNSDGKLLNIKNNFDSIFLVLKYAPDPIFIKNEKSRIKNEMDLLFDKSQESKKNINILFPILKEFNNKFSSSYSSED